MQVQWVERPRVQWLGLVTGDRTKVKLLLTAWAKFRGADSPVVGYGTTEDLTGPWSDRDQTMMDGFVDWWNAQNSEPRAFKQAKADTPSKGEQAALETWASKHGKELNQVEGSGPSNVVVLVGIAAALAIGYALL